MSILLSQLLSMSFSRKKDVQLKAAAHISVSEVGSSSSDSDSDDEEREAHGGESTIPLAAAGATGGANGRCTWKPLARLISRKVAVLLGMTEPVILPRKGLPATLRVKLDGVPWRPQEEGALGHIPVRLYRHSMRMTWNEG